MLHQREKDLVFLVMSKATLPNYWLRKSWHHLRKSDRQARHLHLGCGPKYLPGFVNIDANPRVRTDLWLDVRCGLPFPDASVDSIYSTHMLEHLYPDELEELLSECVRVLKPGGGLRIVVPNLASAVEAYRQRREGWFESWPLSFDSSGGQFSNFIFCSGQHRTAFDFEYMEEVLRKIGFAQITESAEGQSCIYGADVPAFETAGQLPHSLYVEAFRRAGPPFA